MGSPASMSNIPWRSRPAACRSSRRMKIRRRLCRECRMETDARSANSEPSREEVDRMPGPVLLEFGAEWCPYCQAIQPRLAALLSQHGQVHHIRIEDGKGKPLGRSYRVKLWPTLIFMHDGQIQMQMVRPAPEEIETGLAHIAP